MCWLQLEQRKRILQPLLLHEQRRRFLTMLFITKRKHACTLAVPLEQRYVTNTCYERGCSSPNTLARTKRSSSRESSRIAAYVARGYLFLLIYVVLANRVV